MARTKQITRRGRPRFIAPPPPNPPPTQHPISKSNDGKRGKKVTSKSTKRGKNVAAQSTGGKEPRAFQALVNSDNNSTSSSSSSETDHEFESEMNENSPSNVHAASRVGKTGPPVTADAHPSTSSAPPPSRTGPSKAAAVSFAGRGRGPRRKFTPKRSLRAKDLCPVKKVKYNTFILKHF